MAAGVHLSLVLLTADFSPSDRPSGEWVSCAMLEAFVYPCPVCIHCLQTFETLATDGVNCCSVLNQYIETFLSGQRSSVMVLRESYFSLLASTNIKRLLNTVCLRWTVFSFSFSKQAWFCIQKSASYLGEWYSDTEDTYLEELRAALEGGEEELEERFVPAGRNGQAAVTALLAALKRGGGEGRLAMAAGEKEETADILYSSLSKQVHLLVDSAPLKENGKHYNEC